MRNRYLFAADAVAIMLGASAAFSLRFGWLFFQFREEFKLFLVAAIAIKLLTFHAFGLYRRYWRYAGFWDLIAIVLANSAATAVLSIFMVGVQLMGWISGWSRWVPPLDWLFTVAITVGLRASVRAIAETVGQRSPDQGKPSRNVLIVGAGDAGTLVAREMQKNPQMGLVPIGFLDDAPNKANTRIYGLPVLGGIADLASVASAHKIDEAIIAIPRAGGRVVRPVSERCRALGIPSRVVPGFYELLDGQVSVSRLRKVDITDLLRRPQVQAQTSGSAYLAGASVVVTGGGGSIGSELCRQVAHAGPKRLAVLGHGENSVFEIADELRRRFPAVELHVVIADVRDRERLFRVFRDAQPSVVFHAAAHKHVPLMEDNPAEAVTNNILGTRNVADAAAAAGVRHFVLVSTDKAAAPNNIMGASKRVAELVVQQIARSQSGAYTVVRFGNVLGSRGSVVPTFKAQIERGGPVTVTHPDVKRYFMTISEAVHLILQAGGIGQGGELFVLDMGAPVLMRDMAADMIRLSGLDEHEVPIVYTGLRPGEKMDEILWEPGATVEPTACGDIRRVVESVPVTGERLEDVIRRLAAAAARDDGEQIVRLFQECLPTATLAAVPRSVPRGPADVVPLRGA